MARISERFRLLPAAVAGAAILGTLASPASAAEPRAKLVSCGEESCLLVKGYRDDPSAIVGINGQEVAVEGKRRWRISLPLEAVREMSAPHARTIEVSLRDPESRFEDTASVALPIGLLGEVTELAALEITAR